MKKLKKIMFIIISIICLLFLSIFIFLKHPSFGKLPVDTELERIKKSSNYKDGKFQNLSPTPQLTENNSHLSVLWNFIFKKDPNVSPDKEIPTIKNDIKSLDINDEILIWFGHSSYFIQTDKKRILVDPVFSGYVSPVSFTNKSFPGTDIYNVNDLPYIDYLIITHDHWDHLDYNTIKELKNKVNKIICGLGVKSHLEYWGFNSNQIIDMDWYENFTLDENFIINCLPARHFSGRGLKSNQSLWASFLLQTPSSTLYIGGDSGYDSHFKEIGEKFGIIDLAILENGQYNTAWKFIHMMPEEVVQASLDLNAKTLFPVHSSKFALAMHSWYEPLQRVTSTSEEKGVRAITPKIGEIVYFKDSTQTFSKWWEDLN